ncbi:MAG: dihydroorotate dehydrogenase electron transfer subunit [Clostridia bacterium]|nr:dihydroorotate dehydrogenase electron transfer subunit [Candidatus Limimonas egerieequi]MCQ2489317.1 dihydroorotate dehydrogenase electron transfer subunit [Clostridia bacterium]
MKQETFKIVSNKALTSNVYKMSLLGDTDEITAPGQFVNIKIDGLFLRRPISVCDVYGNTLTLVYKVVGAGTKAMSEMGAGDELDMLVGLGNGYDLDLAGERPLLVGGGVGVPPMLYLAKELKFKGANPIVVMGFNTADEVFLEDDFKSRGFETYVTTVDGSYGIKGFVTDAIAELDYTYFYTCGPEPMLKALYSATKTSGEFSFEERMGCGFGACMGCSCKTITGNKRICKEGPVLKKEEILWED